jgi:hypothetical protein
VRRWAKNGGAHIGRGCRHRLHKMRRYDKPRRRVTMTLQTHW